MDTSKFSSDKDAGDGYRDYRKACQTAFDDINAVLEPKPKINKIMATNVMGQAIVDKIGACVGVDAEDNPIWTDPKAANLKPETIELYSFLVSPEGMAQMGMTAREPAGEPSEVLEDALTAAGGPEAVAHAALHPTQPQSPGPKFVAEDQECPGWVNKTGPDARYKETCDACSRNEACAAQVVAKPAARTKKTTEEKEAEKAAKAAEREAKKQERSAARAAGKTSGAPSQTDIIRSLIKETKDRPTIIKGLATKIYAGNEKQAEARMKIYEKAYGALGVNDKKLAA